MIKTLYLLILYCALEAVTWIKSVVYKIVKNELCRMDHHELQHYRIINEQVDEVQCKNCKGIWTNNRYDGTYTPLDHQSKLKNDKMRCKYQGNIGLNI